MLRGGGGVCVEGPAASADLPRVSPRIRALQDRLLDSLPADGAWECLSPAQREAIISLHRARLTRNFIIEGDTPERGKRQNRKNNGNNAKAQTKVLNRYVRSRSYEDKLESETDDSGVRVASGGGRGTNSSSTSNSQNSHEDDSSDPGVKRAGGGRFAKSPSADRLARNKEGGCKTPSHAHDLMQQQKRKGVVTNGVGNVNKIISKQLNNRSGPHQSASNVTLDCRNFQEDRRRLRVDKDGSIFETRQQQNAKFSRYHGGGNPNVGGVKPPEAVISRKNILQRYQNSSPSPTSPVPLKEGKESTSSEEYDSGVNFRFDGDVIDQTLKSPGPRRAVTGGVMDYEFDFESDRTPRSDTTTPSPCSPSRKEGVRGGMRSPHEGQPQRSRSRTSVGADDPMEHGNGYQENVNRKRIDVPQWNADTRNGLGLLPTAVLKRNNDKKAAVSYEAKFKSDFDYRNHLTQQGMMNKYSSNWNSIILSKELPIKAQHRNMNSPLYRTSVAPHGRSAGNLVTTAAAQAIRGGNGGGRYNEKRTKHVDDPMLLDGPHAWEGDPAGGGGGKKFVRSKSLDRKYLEEESSEDESDFEVRRRTERMRRYAKATSQEWEARKQQLSFSENAGGGRGISGAVTRTDFFKQNPLPDYPMHDERVDGAGRPKARSAWDISIGGKPFSGNHENEDEGNHNENGFRSRSTILNRWKSEESELASHPVPRGVPAITRVNKYERRRNEAFNKDASRSRWRRRSCDFELDASDNDFTAGNHPTTSPFPFDGGLSSKQWQRRSCDFELELGNNFEDDEECWDHSLKAEVGLLQQRQRLQSSPPRMEEPRRRRGYPAQESPGSRENGVKKKKVTEKCYLREEETVEEKPFREEEMPAVLTAVDQHQLQYQIRPEITGRKWARIEDLQNYPDPARGYPPAPKHPSKGKNGRSPLGFRENGVLSFENPNYTLGNSLDDALNSNTNTTTNTASTTARNNTSHDGQLDGGLAALDSLYSELDHVCNLTRTSSARNRRHYAQLDIGSMGVDVTKGPVTNLDHADHQNNSLVENEGVMGRKKGGGFTTPQPDIIEHASQRYNYQPQQAQQQQLNNQQINNQDSKSNQNEKDPDKAMVTPDGTESAEEGVQGDSSTSSAASKSPYKERSQESPLNEGHIPHMTPYDSQDLYALPMKRVPSEETRTEDPDAEEKKDPNNEDTLPFGWEKHEDNDGPYYWHIKSGTITRTPPDSSTQVQPHAPLRAERRNKDDQMNVTLSGTVTRSNTSSALSELSEARPRNKAIDNAHKRRSFPARSDLSCDSGGSRPIRFAVRSLGWVEIAEEDLTPERSSKAVNRCIVDLSVGGRRDVLDVVGRWGDGKDLFMDLDEGSLKLVDPENLTVLNTQPIHTIRVWGVGRDNGRDFAYVARDRVTRKHMCHVFRCDTPARTIANTLRDICKKIMIERSLQQNISKPLDSGHMACVNVGRVARPTNLPTEHRRLQRHSQVIPPQSFPTPMEEPKKVMRAQYLGAIEVTKPSGMDVLNAAIKTMADNNPAPWKSVAVAVAPSTITITNTDDGRQIAECRVRFLSFLGIGQNVKHCAFIMHTAQDQFIAHIFYCEPSSGALCKTIEAACKLRYQKCLDAHPGGSGRGRGEATPRSLSATLRSVFTTFAGKKAHSTES